MKTSEFFNQFKGIETYDYRTAITEDIRDGINDFITCNLDKASAYQGHGQDFIRDMLMDSVTGNADGSYWINTWKAECALFGNRDLLEDFAAWEGMPGIMEDSPEVQDVKIRYFLFDECMESVFDELHNEAVQDLTDIELYLMIVIADEWNADYMAEAAKRVDMADAWKNADPDTDLDDVINDILEALREQA